MIIVSVLIFPLSIRKLNGMSTLLTCHGSIFIVHAVVKKWNIRGELNISFWPQQVIVAPSVFMNFEVWEGRISIIRGIRSCVPLLPMTLMRVVYTYYT